MKVYSLIKQQRVPRSLSEVFAFFEDPTNLDRLTPADLDFQILTPQPIAMQPGTLIDYTIKILGVRVRWRTLVTAYEPPSKFVDEQLRGPYDFWHHTHSFTANGNGTLIEDRVCYALPLGLLGRLAHALFVRRQLEAIFAYRAEIIAELFGK